MNLTESQLQEIEENAALFLEPEEIAVIVGIDLSEFVSEIARRKGDVFLAYFRGKTLSKKEIHQNVVKMAKHGSPQAEELATALINKQDLAEKRGRK